MDVKYFCTPYLRELLPAVKQGMFDYLAESPALRHLVVRTTYPDLAFDFNCGMRLQIPAGNWHVKILDHDNETVCFDEDVSDVVLISLEKFFVRWEFLLWLDGNLVVRHVYDTDKRRVHFYFSGVGMGDAIVLFPYVEEFRRKWRCRVSCTVAPYLQELVQLYLPQVECCQPPIGSYATYFPAMSLNPAFCPENICTMPMEKIGRQIFGLDCAEKIIFRPTKPRQIAEPYVCIAAQASTVTKTWLNPDGWASVVEYIKRLGCRVLCIDRDREQTDHGLTMKMPVGAEDFTGNLPLSERVNLLAYAEFFIGVSSGLSWLAWATDCPAILISGMTAHWAEFSAPYRVVNRSICHGCRNDVTIQTPDPDGCSLDGTERAFECSRKISARQVNQTIDRLIADKRAGRFGYPKFL